MLRPQAGLEGITFKLIIPLLLQSPLSPQPQAEVSPLRTVQGIAGQRAPSHFQVLLDFASPCCTSHLFSPSALGPLGRSSSDAAPRCCRWVPAPACPELELLWDSFPAIHYNSLLEREQRMYQQLSLEESPQPHSLGSSPQTA